MSPVFPQPEARKQMAMKYTTSDTPTYDNVCFRASVLTKSCEMIDFFCDVRTISNTGIIYRSRAFVQVSHGQISVHFFPCIG